MKIFKPFARQPMRYRVSSSSCELDSSELRQLHHIRSQVLRQPCLALNLAAVCPQPHSTNPLLTSSVSFLLLCAILALLLHLPPRFCSRKRTCFCTGSVLVLCKLQSICACVIGGGSSAPISACDRLVGFARRGSGRRSFSGHGFACPVMSNSSSPTSSSSSSLLLSSSRFPFQSPSPPPSHHYHRHTGKYLEANIPTGSYFIIDSGLCTRGRRSVR